VEQGLEALPRILDARFPGDDPINLIIASLGNERVAHVE
jgi:hypothetical protein